jgi:uncharacterized protein (DUF2141 family)
MKNIIVAFAMIGLATGAMSQTKLQVTVNNIRGVKGNIMVGIFDSNENFLKKPLDGRMVQASGDSITVVFQNLKPGKYAVSVLHDANKNKDLDQNKLGIPKEGFGFSNNVTGAMGPPSFERALIDLLDQKDLDINIKMKYMTKSGGG